MNCILKELYCVSEALGCVMLNEAVLNVAVLIFFFFLLLISGGNDTQMWGHVHDEYVICKRSLHNNTSDINNTHIPGMRTKGGIVGLPYEVTLSAQKL